MSKQVDLLEAIAEVTGERCKHRNFVVIAKDDIGGVRAHCNDCAMQLICYKNDSGGFVSLELRDGKIESREVYASAEEFFIKKYIKL